MPLYRITVNGRLYEVQIEDPYAEVTAAVVNGERFLVTLEEPQAFGGVAEALAAAPDPKPAAAPAAAATPQPQASAARSAASGQEAEGGTVVAPMPGKVLAVHVAVGDAVQKGDEVLTIEAMKMAMAVRSVADGTVREVRVTPGQAVAHGEVLLVVG